MGPIGDGRWRFRPATGQSPSRAVRMQPGGEKGGERSFCRKFFVSMFLWFHSAVRASRDGHGSSAARKKPR